MAIPTVFHRCTLMAHSRPDTVCCMGGVGAVEISILVGAVEISILEFTITGLILLGPIAGPPGFPVWKVTNSRSSFGKIPKIPVVKLMTYLHANTFIIARKWPTLTHFYQLHKIQ